MVLQKQVKARNQQSKSGIFKWKGDRVGVLIGGFEIHALCRMLGRKGLSLRVRGFE